MLNKKDHLGAAHWLGRRGSRGRFGGVLRQGSALEVKLLVSERD